ncbi:MAG: Chromate resistance protein ChrB, partial [Gemmatimonadales bacterium]
GYTVHQMPADWLLCSYRLPREPSRLRLAIWRRLKRFGAVMVHDGLWVLPKDAKTREDFEWLAEEIEERGGSVMLWEARSLPVGQDSEVVQRFRAEAEERYAVIAQAARKQAATGKRGGSRAQSLEKAMQQLRGLERTFRLERRRDYFRAPGRLQAEETVRAAEEEIHSRLAPVATKRRTHAVGN